MGQGKTSRIGNWRGILQESPAPRWQGTPGNALPPEVVRGTPSVNTPKKSWLNNFYELLADKYREARAPSGQKSRKMSWPAALFIFLQVIVGIQLLPYAPMHWHPESELRFACFFVLPCPTSVRNGPTCLGLCGSLGALLPMSEPTCRNHSPIRLAPTKRSPRTRMLPVRSCAAKLTIWPL